MKETPEGWPDGAWGVTWVATGSQYLPWVGSCLSRDHMPPAWAESVEAVLLAHLAFWTKEERNDG